MKRIKRLFGKLTYNPGLFGDRSKKLVTDRINELSDRLNEVIDVVNKSEEGNGFSADHDVYAVKTTDLHKARGLVKVSDFQAALFEIKFNMWRDWKHDPDSLTLESLRVKLNEIFERYGITEEDIS